MSGARIGVGIVGLGRQGMIRAGLVAGAPQTRFLALADSDERHLERKAHELGADFHSLQAESVIGHPQVDAVIVGADDGRDIDAACLALQSGKPLLVERPFARTLEGGRRIVNAHRLHGGDLHVAYTQRCRLRYVNAKEQLMQARVGRLTTARLSLYLPIAETDRIAGDQRFTALAELVDLATWFFDDGIPARVYAQGTSIVQHDTAEGIGDGAWALLTLDDNRTIHLGYWCIQPSNWPARFSLGMELIGTRGAFMIDDSHKDSMLVAQGRGGATQPSATGPQVQFLESAMTGDRLLDRYWGPMQDETRLFLEHAASGRWIPLTTAEQALRTLEVAFAIGRSVGEGRPVDMRLA